MTNHVEALSLLASYFCISNHRTVISSVAWVLIWLSSSVTDLWSQTWSRTHTHTHTVLFVTLAWREARSQSLFLKCAAKRCRNLHVGFLVDKEVVLGVNPCCSWHCHHSFDDPDHITDRSNWKSRFGDIVTQSNSTQLWLWLTWIQWTELFGAFVLEVEGKYLTHFLP